LLIQSVAFRHSAAFSDCPRRQHPDTTHTIRTGSCQPSLLYPPHKPNASPVKKVSLRRRQQADTPNHCSSSNKSVYKLLWYCCTCNALRAAIAGLSYCLQFLRLRSGSYCVLHATSFITSFVTLHYTSFAAKQFASSHGLHCHYPIQDTCSHMPFRKPTLQYSLGSITLHYVIHLLQ
jgi:hypothetical protein